MVLEKTLDSPLDSKGIQPVHSEGDQPWDFFGRNDAKAKLQYFGPLMRRVDSLEKTLMLGGIGGKRRRGWQRMRFAGLHHWLDGCESWWTPGVGDGQGSLACCDSLGHKESDTTEWLIWSDLIWLNTKVPSIYKFCGCINALKHSLLYSEGNPSHILRGKTWTESWILNLE